MAGKQYTMEFRLQSQLAGSFNSTFKQAQQQLAGMQNEIRQLNSLQKDISAWQKQQNAIQKTQNTLKSLQEQQSAVEKAMKSDGGSVELQQKQAELKAKIQNTNITLTEQKDKLSQLSNSLNAAGVDTNDLASESKRLETEMGQLKQKQEDVADSAQKMGNKSSEAINDLEAALAAAGVAKALKEIYDGFMACATAAGDFEQSMSNVQALSGASGEELESLSNKAKEMGATTSYTAKESADAMSYMALAGWETESMLAGIEPILNLAAAANMDLATASDIVTDNLTAFGLTADDTGLFVDQMAYAMSHSNTNVTQLGEAYKSCAATAKSMGFSVEDTTAVLMNMANAGVKGSEAGTAVNTVMTRLATNTKDCADELAEYGVQVYDAQGNMNSLSNIMTGITGVFATLTQEEQANLAKAIAGTNQYSKFQTMLQGCSEAAQASGQSMSDYSAALETCSGSAGTMATTMLDNMNGKMTLAQSAWEGMTIAIGEQFTPALSNLYEAAANVFSGIGSFVSQYPIVVKALAAIGVGIATVTAAVTAYTVATKLAKIASQALQAIMSTNPWFLAASVGIAAVAAAITLFATVSADAEKTSDHLISSIQEQDKEIASLESQYQEACKTFGETSTEAGKLALQIDEAKQSASNARITIGELGEQIKKTAQNAEEAVSSYHDAAEENSKLKNEAVGLISELMILQNRTTLTNTDMDLMSSIVGKLNTKYSELGLTIDSVSGKLNYSTDDLFKFVQEQYDAQNKQSAIDTITTLIGSYIEQKNNYDTAYKAANTAWHSVAEVESKNNLERGTLWYDINKLFNTDNLGTYTDEWYEQQKLMDEAADSIASITQQAYDAAIAYGMTTEEATQFASELEQGYANLESSTDSAESSVADYQEVATQAYSVISSNIQDLAQRYYDAYDAAYSSFHGQFGLFDEASTASEEYLNATVANAQAALDSQLNYWNSYNSNIEYLKEKSYQDLGITQDQYENMMTYISSGSEEAAGLAQSMVDNIKSGNEEAVAELGKTISKVNEAQQQAASSVADLTTEYTVKLNEFVTASNKTIDELDLSDEAKAAAQKTMNGYADQLKTTGAQAVDTAKNIASQVNAQLNNIKTDYQITITAVTEKIEKNARGTTNAADIFIAGEEGPELIVGQQGATVFPATETARIFSAVQSLSGMDRSVSEQGSAARTVQALPSYSSGGVSYVVTIAPQFSVTGADSSSFEQVIYGYLPVLKDMVMEGIQEQASDAARRAY